MNKPQDWIKAIHEKEREYQFLWYIPQGDEGKNFSYIGMFPVASSSQVAFISIEYRSKDYDKCKSIIDEKENDPF